MRLDIIAAHRVHAPFVPVKWPSASGNSAVIDSADTCPCMQGLS
jgi:hypothetical protein